jgi:hypothetical protein
MTTQIRGPEAAYILIDRVFAPLRAENERLRKALGKAADTFADFERALRLLKHNIAADAAVLAAQAIRAALAAKEETSE